MRYISRVEMYKNRQAGRAFRRRVRNTILIVAAVALVYGWWSTRDTTPRWEVIAKAKPVSLVIQDPLDRRARMAESALWNALPPNPFVARAQTLLAADPGLPHWLLRNVLGSAVYLTAGDWNDPESALAVTRMTRVGVLAERVWSRFGGGVERDEAGGLELRSVEDGAFYYAVRGRTLVGGLSRQTLIAALTLAPEEAVSPEQFAEALGQRGAEDVRGNIVLDPSQPGAEYIRAVAFAARLDDQDAKIRWRIQLQPDVERRLGALLQPASVDELPRPPAGPVRIALNLGVPLGRVADVLAAASENGESVWQTWRRAPEDADGLVPHMIARLVDASGPAVALSVVGADLDEMIPVPLLLWVAEGDPALPREVGDILAAASAGALHPPVVDAARNLAAYPYMGGPSLTPAIAAYRGAIVASNSLPAVENYIAQGPAPAAGPAMAGHLSVEVEPGPLADILLGAGQLFADVGAIRGHTAESFAQAAVRWRAQAQAFGTATLTGAVNDNGLDLELTVRLAGAPAP